MYGNAEWIGHPLHHHHHHDTSWKEQTVDEIPLQSQDTVPDDGGAAMEVMGDAAYAIMTAHTPRFINARLISSGTPLRTVRKNAPSSGATHERPESGRREREKAAKRPASVSDLLSRVHNLIIGFLTNAYIRLIMRDSPSTDVFFVYVALLALALILYNVARALLHRLEDESGGSEDWTATLVSVLDFIAVTLILTVAQYAPMLATQYWLRVGFSDAELSVFPMMAVVAVFAVYRLLFSDRGKGG